MVWASLCLTGPVLFFGFLYWTGRPLPSEVYERYWKTEVCWPWVTLADVWNQVNRQGDIGVALNFGILLLTVTAALCWNAKKQYLLYTLCLTLFLLTKKSDPTQQQWARYGMILFPAYAGMACRVVDKGLFAALSLMLALLNVFLLGVFLAWSMVV